MEISQLWKKIKEKLMLPKILHGLKLAKRKKPKSSRRDCLDIKPRTQQWECTEVQELECSYVY